AVMSRLMERYRQTGNQPKLVRLLEEMVELAKAGLGPNHRDTLTYMNNLAMTYEGVGKPEKALPLYEELLPLVRKQFGRDHPNTLMTVANLGVLYRDADRPGDARPLLEEAYRASARYPALRNAGLQLLDGYRKAGKTAGAVKLIG